MKMKKLSYIGAVGIWAIASYTQAAYVQAPWAPDNPARPAEQNLYQKLGFANNAALNAAVQNVETWQAPTSGNQYSALVVELAGYRNYNSFGIYEVGNTGNTLQLFPGTESPVSQKQITFSYNALADVITISVGASSINLGTGNTDFGFYLNAPAPVGSHTFYSENALNEVYGGNNVQHVVAFDINATLYGQLPYNPNNSGWVMGWEDIYYGGDQDFQDLMVTFTAQPIPEPTTVLAGALLLLPFGLSTIRSWRKHRR